MSRPADVVDLLTELGGVARRGALLRVITRADLERSVESGAVLHDGCGAYALPGADKARRAAQLARGVISHASAAHMHGWAVLEIPQRPHVTVSRGREIPRGLDIQAFRASLRARDIVDGVTSHERTLIDCTRNLPFCEALIIADSALRLSGCSQMLQRIADEARGPGSRQIKRVAIEATALSESALESALRAICLDVPGLDVEPQVTIRDTSFIGRSDLVDRRRRLILEADSFEFHGSRRALVRDARRYNRMVFEGWTVLRFTYEDIVGDPETVRRRLIQAVELTETMNYRVPEAPKRTV